MLVLLLGCGVGASALGEDFFGLSSSMGESFLLDGYAPKSRIRVGSVW